MVISKFVSFLFIFEYYSNKIYENVEIIHLSSVKRYKITKQSKYYKIEPLPHVMKDNYNQAYNSIPDKICSHKYCKHCGNSNLGWHGISVQWHDFISWLPVKLKKKKKKKKGKRQNNQLSTSNATVTTSTSSPHKPSSQSGSGAP